MTNQDISEKGKELVERRDFLENSIQWIHKEVETVCRIFDMAEDGKITLNNEQETALINQLEELLEMSYKENRIATKLEREIKRFVKKFSTPDDKKPPKN